VVVLVIAVLAAIAIPAIGYWIEQYRLGIAAQQVADALQATKMHAVAKTRRTELLFDVAGNRLGREGSTLVDLPAGVRFDAADAGRPPPDSSVTMSGPVTFPPLSEDASLRAAAFTGRGLPDVDPGEDHAVFLTNRTGTRAVVMTSAGNVRVWEWAAGEWK
jgi:Tfp pilus assembly protein FimT